MSAGKPSVPAQATDSNLKWNNSIVFCLDADAPPECVVKWEAERKRIGHDKKYSGEFFTVVTKSVRHFLPSLTVIDREESGVAIFDGHKKIQAQMRPRSIMNMSDNHGRFGSIQMWTAGQWAVGGETVLIKAIVNELTVRCRAYEGIRAFKALEFDLSEKTKSTTTCVPMTQELSK